MLVSLNWIRDFVDLPADLDPRELAERFTCITAEVDKVERVEVAARGLIAARIQAVAEIPGASKLHLVTLDVGQGKTVETVTAAPVLPVGRNVVYAPEGGSVAAMPTIGTAKVAGKTSVGMIVPGEAIGIAMAVQEAIVLDDSIATGEELQRDPFDDWVLDIDNKSITHRPDLWGHYGIAREMAAIVGRPLKPYPAVSVEELGSPELPEIPISIADPTACPRYSGLVFEGVPTQPAPLWMQLRLGHIGMRPISGLVDLTNYIMVDLGQPMHAFDAARVDRIEVDWAQEGERFRTLDGVKRKLVAKDLMIKCQGKSVALAGVMGGLQTEVSEATTSLLLESANFEPATIRRTSKRLGLRSDASARFEKSLDPTNTVSAIRRFVELAGPMYPDFRLTGRLSDSFPCPPEPVTVSVDPTHVSRTIGREIPGDDAARLLAPLGFEVTTGDSNWNVLVPSFRATGDVSIEVDIIEEVARCAGYDKIDPVMPLVTVRHFPPNRLHQLEQRTLEYFATAHGFHEIHGFLWYDKAWLEQLGVDPGVCVELANPAASGLHLMRRTLLPGLLGAVARNRFHFPALSLVELGSVFHPAAGHDGDREFRHVALALAEKRKDSASRLDERLRTALTGWVWNQFGRAVRFREATAAPQRPWEHPDRTARLLIDGTTAGRISVVDLPMRRAMDDHLAAWSIVWAELWLSHVEHLERVNESRGAIPAYPLVDMDFCIVVARSTRYDEIVAGLSSFEHALLRSIRYVSSYESKADEDRRRVTFRTVIGDEARTLVDEDLDGFRGAFERHVTDCGYEILTA